MGEFAKRVEAAYASRSVREVHVPEWNLTLHIAPLTILQLQKIQAEPDPYRRAARIVQVRGKNAEGRNQFDEADFDALCAYGIDGFGPQVTARVAGEIMADLQIAEGAAKN